MDQFTTDQTYDVAREAMQTWGATKLFGPTTSELIRTGETTIGMLTQTLAEAMAVEQTTDPNDPAVSCTAQAALTGTLGGRA